jgi:multiple sugar transport system permease protein
MVGTENRKRQVAQIWRLILTHVLMIGIGVVMIGPLLWMLSTSLKEPKQVFDFVPRLIPNPVKWSNYREAFDAAPFLLYFWNSAKISTITMVGQLLFSSLAAYAFARLRFPLKNQVFALLLSTMMIPYTVRVIPLYAIFRALGWIDTHLPLIVPQTVSNVFGVFLLRQFFMTLPYELEEAARLDGCTSFQIYHMLMMPLAKPALAALGLFTFMSSWNAFLPPLIFVNSNVKQTLQVGLTIFQGEFMVEWHLLMAGAVTAILPVLTVYMFAQRYFIQGITLTGLKG